MAPSVPFCRQCLKYIHKQLILCVFDVFGMFKFANRPNTTLVRFVHAERGFQRTEEVHVRRVPDYMQIGRAKLLPTSALLYVI